MKTSSLTATLTGDIFFEFLHRLKLSALEGYIGRLFIYSNNRIVLIKNNLKF